MASSGGATRQDIENLNIRFPNEQIDKLFISGLSSHPNKMSGSRQHLWSLQFKKMICINNPETPYVYTGYEKSFGDKSDGYKKADSDYMIINKIYRHTELPNMKYMLVLQDLTSGIYTVEEVCHYESLAEMHGYMRDETKTDHLQPGQIIQKGDFFYKSSTLDEYGNYRYGINANVAFVNTLNCVADAVFISDEFAKKAAFHTIEETEVVLDMNDILLNLHGNSNYYQSLPSIGADITEKGILCARRKIDFSLASSNLTESALMECIESDDIFRGKGKVVDIDIFVNRHEDLLDNTDPFRNQLKFLYNDQLRYNREIYDTLHRIIIDPNNKYTHSLRQIYDSARNYINNSQLDTNLDIKYSNNNGKFDFIYLIIKVAHNRALNIADKLTNRSAAKGVISEIVPKEYMFRDEYGNVADVCFAGKGIIGRLNISQVYEHELNFIANRIVHKMLDLTTVEERFNLMHEFISKVNLEQADKLKQYWKKLNKVKKEEFIEDILRKKQIYIYQPPFYGNITLEQMEHLYDYYKIKPSYARFKMKFSIDKNRKNNFISESDLELEKTKYQYIMMKDKSKYKIDVDYFNKSIENNENIVTAANGSQYIRSPNKITVHDLDYHEDNSIWKKLEQGLKVLKESFNELNHKEFNSTKSYNIIDKDGNLIRDFRTIRPLIIAPLYVVVLKQIADTGFSARSLDNVNHLGTPIKSSKINVGKAYNPSPIAYGFMDICNCSSRISMDIVHRFKSIYASNPEFRQEMTEVLLTNDPFKLHNISVKLEETYNDVPARMWKTYFWILHIGFLEKHEKDPFAKFDAPEFANLNQVFKKHGTINI